MVNVYYFLKIIVTFISVYTYSLIKFSAFAVINLNEVQGRELDLQEQRAYQDLRKINHDQQKSIQNLRVNLTVILLL